METARVTFEQAKSLKKKGFDIEVNKKYSKYGHLSKYLQFPENINQYNFDGELSAPEQYQVVEWLRVKHGIFISVLECNDKSGYYWRILDEGPSTITFNLPQEAYSAAIDYVLAGLKNK